MQPSPLPGSQQMMSPTKDINVVTMCRMGQEIVHDIVNRAQDVFTLLGPKNMQLPNNMTFYGQQYGERKAKLDEHLRQISLNFRKLRIFYTKINEVVDQTEIPPEQDLIPIGETSEGDAKKREYNVDFYVSDQHREMVEQVKLKNQQLKEVMDCIRSIIWEINTMITMRKG